ncbi:UNVERIFIED_CONTAM: hypothetical protein RMT77_018541 [Armadillidium vulgare]
MDSLTPKEKDILNEFRGRVVDKVPPHLSSDFELSRWLIARNFNINKAEAMLLKSLEWRKEWNMDNIADWNPPEVLKKYFPSGIPGYDKEGNPVIIIPYGNADIRGLIKSCNTKELIKYFAQIFENAVLIMRERSRDRGEPIGKLIDIVDLEKFSLGDFSYRPALAVVLKFIDIFESNYPEILRCCYVINAPKAFSVAFNILKPFLSEKTLNKIKIHGKNGWKEGLLKMIDEDQLPVHWGGTMTDPDGNTRCISKICIGGKVPKEYYLKNKLLVVQNQNLHLDFKSHITLKKTESKIFEFQVLENVGSQLRWEFRSTGCDIAYEISRTISEEVEELIPLQRVNSQVFKEEGSLICDEKGLYKIMLKNEYSDKDVDLYYNIDLKKSEGQIDVQLVEVHS